MTEFLMIHGVKFHIVPLETNEAVNKNNVYDTISEAHTLRFIRLMMYCGTKEIYIHTNTWENTYGWAYALHTIYIGVYACEFVVK